VRETPGYQRQAEKGGHLGALQLGKKRKKWIKLKKLNRRKMQTMTAWDRERGEIAFCIIQEGLYSSVVAGFHKKGRATRGGRNLLEKKTTTLGS